MHDRRMSSRHNARRSGRRGRRFKSCHPDAWLAGQRFVSRKRSGPLIRFERCVCKPSSVYFPRPAGWLSRRVSAILEVAPGSNNATASRSQVQTEPQAGCGTGWPSFPRFPADGDWSFWREVGSCSRHGQDATGKTCARGYSRAVDRDGGDRDHEGPPTSREQDAVQILLLIDGACEPLSEVEQACPDHAPVSGLNPSPWTAT